MKVKTSLNFSKKAKKFEKFEFFIKNTKKNQLLWPKEELISRRGTEISAIRICNRAWSSERKKASGSRLVSNKSGEKTWKLQRGSIGTARFPNISAETLYFQKFNKIIVLHNPFFSPSQTPVLEWICRLADRTGWNYRKSHSYMCKLLGVASAYWVSSQKA